MQGGSGRIRGKPTRLREDRGDAGVRGWRQRRHRRMGAVARGHRHLAWWKHASCDGLSAVRTPCAQATAVEKSSVSALGSGFAVCKPQIREFRFARGKRGYCLGPIGPLLRTCFLYAYRS